MAFLSEVRNRALLPLELYPSVKFDKLLFVNDVIFNPIDAAQLLFSTNINESGHAQYGAACPLDFINYSNSTIDSQHETSKDTLGELLSSLGSQL